jgi:hypothetical protein
MSRSTCEHFVPLEDGCEKCVSSSRENRILILERRVDDILDMLAKRDNELATLKAETKMLRERGAVLLNGQSPNMAIPYITNTPYTVTSKTPDEFISRYTHNKRIP